MLTGKSNSFTSLLSSIRPPSITDSSNQITQTQIVHEALVGNYERVSYFLTVAGVSPNCKDNDGWTCLHAAAYRGHTRICKLLLAKGANIHHVDGEGWTALHWASRYGYMEICNLLIDNGIDVVALNKYSESATDKARQGRHMKIVKLIKGGIDARMKKSQYLLARKASLELRGNHASNLHSLQQADEDDIHDIDDLLVSVLDSINHSDVGKIDSDVLSRLDVNPGFGTAKRNYPMTPPEENRSRESIMTTSTISKARALDGVSDYESESILQNQALEAIQRDYPLAAEFWVQNFEMYAAAVPIKRFFFALEIFNNGRFHLPPINLDEMDAQMFKILLNGPLKELFAPVVNDVGKSVNVTGSINDAVVANGMLSGIFHAVAHSVKPDQEKLRSLLSAMEMTSAIPRVTVPATAVSGIPTAGKPDILSMIERRNPGAYMFWMDNFLTPDAVDKESFNLAIQMRNSTGLAVPQVEAETIDARMFNILCNGPLAILFPKTVNRINP